MPALDPESEQRLGELRQQIEERPNDRNDLMAEIGAIYLDAGRPVEALEAWRDAPWARVFGERSALVYLRERADEFERRGHLRAATRAFEEAIRAGRPRDEAAYELVLSFVFALGLFIHAGWLRSEVDGRLAQAREKLAGNPRFTTMWFQLGMSHAFRCELSEALQAFESFHRLSSLRQDREHQIEALTALVRAAAERNEALEGGGAAGGGWALPNLHAARRAPWPQPLESLRAAGLDDEEALAWVREGFDVKSSATWRRAGVDARNAKLYGMMGFDPDVARAMIERGQLASASAPIRGRDQLRAWEEAGLTLDDALDADGLGVGDAVRWRGAGFSLQEVKPWLRAGIGPEVAGAWRRAGADLAGAMDWARAGVAPGEVGPWLERSIRAPAAARWRAAGFSPGAAGGWLDAGIHEPEASDWRRLGLGPRDALPWRKHGFSPADRSEWTAACFGLEEAYGWRSHGFDVRAASAERGRGRSARQALEHRRFEGLLSYEPQGHKALLFWGLVFTAPGQVPWQDDGAERHVDQWAERFRRLAPAGVALDDAGCMVDVYGKPASLSTCFVSVRESMVEALDGRPRRFDQPRVTAAWSDRLKRFCDILRIPVEAEPTWWLTATLWE